MDVVASMKLNRVSYSAISAAVTLCIMAGVMASQASPAKLWEASMLVKMSVDD
jgi:hypothetical protein